jgi:hypothetical protein
LVARDEIHDGRKVCESEGIDDQSVFAGFRDVCCSICPFLRHGEAAKLGMAHAQYRNAGNVSDLQYDKPLAAQRMERMGDLSRTQRLAG